MARPDPILAFKIRSWLSNRKRLTPLDCSTWRSIGHGLFTEVWAPAHDVTSALGDRRRPSVTFLAISNSAARTGSTALPALSTLPVRHSYSDAIFEQKTFARTEHLDMIFTEFEAKRQFVDIPAGRIAYVEGGSGPVALFLHGRLLNGYFWRHQLRELSDIRRCIAVDLMAHGATSCKAGQNVSYDGQAAMIKQFLDSRQIDRVDLVGNDSGTAIAQIFATNNPQRVRTLTLTDGRYI